MDGLVKPATSEVVPEVLHEHLELAHYIDVFRSSTERVRRVIFIIMIFSVMMLVAQWNTTDSSWVPRRYTRLSETYQETRSIVPAAAADSAIAKKTGGRFKTLEELQTYLHEYIRQRVEKVFLVQIPGIGVTFDINDLGNFCGLAYLLLLLILLFSIMRQHENLYLALFKVRRLHDHALRKSDGESAANYLYHALAMSQVLASPPTLAQWKPSAFKRTVLHTIFFVPAFVQGYIIYVNAITILIARTYGASPHVMLPEYLLFAINFVLGLVAFFYARACNSRWHSAFLYINPSLRYVTVQPWRTWLKWPGATPTSRVQRHLWSNVVEQLKLSQNAQSIPVTAHHVVTLDNNEITYKHVKQMCAELEMLATEEARKSGEPVRVLAAKVTSSVLSGREWRVDADFEVESKGTKAT